MGGVEAALVTDGGNKKKPKAKHGNVPVRGRELSKTTVKAMLNWAHYAQRKRLKELAARTPGFTVIEVDEPWTSRTCSTCGILAEKSKSKTFNCQNKDCKMRCDRDLNAAKNILLL